MFFFTILLKYTTIKLGDTMLVNGIYLLKKALKEGYAIPAYNINNLEWTRFILEACNLDRSPVILGVSESAVKYFGGYKTVYNVVTSLIDDLNVKVPVVLHLDHGQSFESCKKAIDAGFTSVMIDASNKSLEENIDITNKVKEYANAKQVCVEAELGSLDGDLTEVNSAIEFVSRTDVNSLAPAIGNKHGIYQEDAKIDFELLGSICKEVKLPIVLHGASGLDDNKIKTAIFCGVSKVNINTDLQLVWTKSVKLFMDNNPNVYDPRKIIKSSEDSFKALIYYKNSLLGSSGKAF